MMSKQTLTKRVVTVLLAVLISLSALMSSAVFAVTPQPKTIYGDFNGDNKISVADAVAFLGSLLFEKNNLTIDAWDLNSDNKITTTDVIFLINHILFPDQPQYTLDAGFAFVCRVAEDDVLEYCYKSSGKREETDRGMVTEIHDDYVVVSSSIHPKITFRLEAEDFSSLCSCVNGEMRVGSDIEFSYTTRYVATSKNGERRACKLIEWDELHWAAKPVIYLYPEEEIKANVTLDLNGELTCTYPKYNDGWNVTAYPDGTLVGEDGKTYYYLYWEGLANVNPSMDEGFCVKGNDTALFLEDALDKLGLSRREANDFITYWLPQMECNEYNRISFLTDSYTDQAILNVTPEPDTVIRVFMAWEGCDSYVEMTPQTLTAPARDGFTVVEWGGSNLGLGK